MLHYVLMNIHTHPRSLRRSERVDFSSQKLSRVHCLTNVRHRERPVLTWEREGKRKGQERTEMPWCPDSYADLQEASEEVGGPCPLQPPGVSLSAMEGLGLIIHCSRPSGPPGG